MRMRRVDWHFGDYLADTAHLSDLEDLAYRRMLEVYYMTEKPLESDPFVVARRIRFRSDDHVAAVKSVLAEFFTLEGEFWRHKRCDAEITAYQKRIVSASNNGKKGGRGHRKANPLHSLSETKPATKPAESKPLTNHPPSTIHHPPGEKNKRAPVLVRVDTLIADGLDATLAQEWLEHRKRKHANLTPAAWDGIKAEAIKAEITPSEAVRKALARGWTGFEASWITTQANGSKQRRVEQANRTAANEFVRNGCDDAAN